MDTGEWKQNTIQSYHYCIIFLINLSRSKEASHTIILRGAFISSLPTNACSSKNNIPFPLFYLRGKWQINSFEITCWQAKQDS